MGVAVGAFWSGQHPSARQQGNIHDTSAGTKQHLLDLGCYKRPRVSS